MPAVANYRNRLVCAGFIYGRETANNGSEGDDGRRATSSATWNRRTAVFWAESDCGCGGAPAIVTWRASVSRSCSFGGGTVGHSSPVSWTALADDNTDIRESFRPAVRRPCL